MSDGAAYLAQTGMELPAQNFFKAMDPIARFSQQMVETNAQKKIANDKLAQADAQFQQTKDLQQQELAMRQAQFDQNSDIEERRLQRQEARDAQAAKYTNALIDHQKLQAEKEQRDYLKEANIERLASEFMPDIQNAITNKNASLLPGKNPEDPRTKDWNSFTGALMLTKPEMLKSIYSMSADKDAKKTAWDVLPPEALSLIKVGIDPKTGIPDTQSIVTNFKTLQEKYLIPMLNEGKLSGDQMKGFVDDYKNSLSVLKDSQDIRKSYQESSGQTSAGLGGNAGEFSQTYIPDPKDPTKSKLATPQELDKYMRENGDLSKIKSISGKGGTVKNIKSFGKTDPRAAIMAAFAGDDE
jgi:hypothetical protein